ncbi:MAG: site-2 protease family protein, partial [Thermoplasmata archaeon]|nr:site-2 protease family protein [Thermoplasmata archaeon]
VVNGSIAEKNEIKKGYVIYEINGIKIDNVITFQNFMNSTHENEKINISYYYNGTYGEISLILDNKYNFTNNERDDGKGFIGVEVVDIKTLEKFNRIVDSFYFPSLYNPFKTKFFIFVSLPFKGLSPFPKELINLYDFPLQSIFLPLMNFFYWLFWLNFALGTFNALPAAPLDGGYVFKDGVSWLIEKLRLKKGEKIVTYITSGISFMILLAIFSIILIPNLRALI